MSDLLGQIHACTLCQAQLPLGPRPVLQFDPGARILIAGQAPGRKVHETGIPFNDPSGDRLRQWLGVTRAQFYDPELFALVPMGFCYPGSGRSGDLPPRPECATTWRDRLLTELTQLQLTLVLGQYAQRYHFGSQHRTVTGQVKAWKSHWPARVPMPHPSPRNIRWLKQNPWFEAELLPALRARVAALLSG